MNTSHPSNAFYRKRKVKSLAGPFALTALIVLFTAGCGNSSTGTTPSNGDKAYPAGVIRLAGAPGQMGSQHGKQLKTNINTMIQEYIGTEIANDRLNAKMQARIETMKPSLPAWYLKELKACAKEAGINEDVLLYAQCEGDVKGLGGCTTYVASGPAVAGGKMEMGRNFDYWGLDSTSDCAAVFAHIPKKEDGYAFVSVGWSGILGGWTFVNEKGLFVANNLGGFAAKNPKGVPTLILLRMIAQKSATVKEAIALIKSTPRMRGQALIIGQAEDKSTGRVADAAVVLYDAKRVEVKRAENGFAFHSSIGTDMNEVLENLKKADRKPTDVIQAAGNSLTLHSVSYQPATRKIFIAHGKKSSAHKGKYVAYSLDTLLKR